MPGKLLCAVIFGYYPCCLTFYKLHIIHSPKNFNYRIQPQKQLQVSKKLKDKNWNPDFSQELVQDTNLPKIK